MSTEPFHPTGERDQATWLADAFRTAPVVGHYAIPDLFDDAVSVLAHEAGSTFDNGSGATDPQVSRALVTTLSAFTSTPHECYFAVWKGYAGLRDLGSTTTFQLPPQREMVLFAGSIESAISSVETPVSDRRPVRWWPADHSWLVGADIYANTLTIGGTAACIAALRRNADLTALPRA